MEKKMLVIICATLLAMTVLSFVKKERAGSPNIPVSEHASENARFKREGELFNSQAHQKARANILAEEQAREVRKQQDEAQDKGEGQFKVQF